VGEVSGRGVTRSREDSVEATITQVGRFGDGVWQGNGPPVYVRGALPGERVRIGRSAKDGKILRAPLIEVLSPIASRAATTCSVLSRCGGCPLGHAARPWQAELKRGWLADALRSQALDPDAIAITVVTPEPARAYRTRARLAWDARRGRPRLGYREGGEVTVIEPVRCEVLAPALDAARVLLAERLAPHLGGVGELHLSLTELPDASGTHVVARLGSADPQPSSFYGAIEALVRDGSLAGATVRVGGAGVAKVYCDRPARSRDFDGRLLAAEVGSFRQAHLAASSELGARVLGWARAEGEHVLELFAGHGHFTLALASRARTVVAVELDAGAVRALTENARAHRLDLEARAEDAAAFLATLEREVRAKKRARPSVVVLDPPRAGAAACVPGLASLAPDRVVYVSCDAPTLARDAARLASSGLVLREIALIDLFPDTLHVELVALFGR